MTLFFVWQVDLSSWITSVGFIRAYRRDGDRNDSLIPQDIMDCHSDDELSSDSDASVDLNIETDEE